MNAFEYVAVLASVIIGLALVDILVSLNRLLRAGRAVRWHWAAPAGAALVTMTLVQIWWGLYQPEATPMTIGEFLPILVQLVLLFLLAASALPDDTTPDGFELKAYYNRNAPYFWGLFAAALGWLTAVEMVDAARRGRLLEFIANREGDFIVLLVFISLIFIRWRWWQVAAFLFLSLGPIGWLSRSL